MLLRIIRSLDRSCLQPFSIIPESGPIERELSALQVPFTIVDLRFQSSSRLQQVLQSAQMAIHAIRWRPAVVHSNELPYRGTALAAFGARRVCHIHHPGSTPDALKWSFVRKPDVIITPSQFVADEVRACTTRNGVDVPIRVVGNPVDVDWFRPAEDRGAIRRKRGMQKGEWHVSILGMLAPHKGHDCFLRMARVILETEPNCRFHIVGADGRSRDHSLRLRALAETLGISDRVRFWGEVCNETARDVLAASDLFVLPTTEEGFCLALAEAQACGVPILSSAIRPLDEIVVPGVSGFLLPAGDVDSFGQKALELLRDPHARQKMGDAGRRFIVERFGMPDFMRTMMEVYQG
ncbi:MAG: glycosyltransferase family 4 protein [Planctomycetes bacterium]|nr:glycosyltransferase family 4 protein [Planctomycetota bacterium]